MFHFHGSFRQNSDKERYEIDIYVCNSIWVDVDIYYTYIE